MTDKQMIIDGLSCDNCPELKRCQEQQTKKEYAINQVLQDIPSEYANMIDRLKQIIPSITRCDYVLEKQLKRQEQECEDLKKIINGAKNSNLDFKSFLVGEAVQNKYEQQLDQLKAENESLKEGLKMFSSTLDWALKSQVGLYKRQIDSSVPDD